MQGSGELLVRPSPAANPCILRRNLLPSTPPPAPHHSACTPRTRSPTRTAAGRTSGGCGRPEGGADSLAGCLLRRSPQLGPLLLQRGRRAEPANLHPTQPPPAPTPTAAASSTATPTSSAPPMTSSTRWVARSASSVSPLATAACPARRCSLAAAPPGPPCQSASWTRPALGRRAGFLPATQLKAAGLPPCLPPLPPITPALRPRRLQQGQAGRHRHGSVRRPHLLGRRLLQHAAGRGRRRRQARLPHGRARGRPQEALGGRPAGLPPAARPPPNSATNRSPLDPLKDPAITFPSYPPFVPRQRPDKGARPLLSPSPSAPIDAAQG
jgi:hypothetical protein